MDEYNPNELIFLTPDTMQYINFRYHLQTVKKSLPQIQDDVLLRMVSKYYEICEYFSIRPDVPLAQVLYAYKDDNQTTLENNNPGKLASLQSAKTLEQFATIDAGVCAHMQRLCKLLNCSEVVESEYFKTDYDPRIQFVVRGAIKPSRTIQALSGAHSWSDPGYDKRRYRSLHEAELHADSYGTHIQTMVNNMRIDLSIMTIDSTESESPRIIWPVHVELDVESDDDVITETPIAVPDVKNEPMEKGTDVTKSTEPSAKDYADQFLQLVDTVYDQVSATYAKRVCTDTFGKRLRLIFYRTKDLEDAKVTTYFIVKHLKDFRTNALDGAHIGQFVYIIVPRPGESEYTIQFIPPEVERKLYGSAVMNKIRDFMKSDSVKEEISLNPIISFY